VAAGVFLVLRSWRGSRHQQTGTQPGVAPLLIQSRGDRHCHRCNLLNRGLRRLEHVHEQPPNYTVTFTATTASTKQTINFTLTVNCTAKQLSLVKFTG
jgi:hypothetical protein